MKRPCKAIILIDCALAIQLNKHISRLFEFTAEFKGQTVNGLSEDFHKQHRDRITIYSKLHSYNAGNTYIVTGLEVAVDGSLITIDIHHKKPDNNNDYLHREITYNGKYLIEW